jgi:hypothetical protein
MLVGGCTVGVCVLACLSWRWCVCLCVCVCDCVCVCARARVHLSLSRSRYLSVMCLSVQLFPTLECSIFACFRAFVCQRECMPLHSSQEDGCLEHHSAIASS